MVIYRTILLLITRIYTSLSTITNNMKCRLARQCITCNLLPMMIMCKLTCSGKCSGIKRGNRSILSITCLAIYTLQLRASGSALMRYFIESMRTWPRGYSDQLNSLLTLERRGIRLSKEFDIIVSHLTLYFCYSAVEGG